MWLCSSNVLKRYALIQTVHFGTDPGVDPKREHGQGQITVVLNFETHSLKADTHYPCSRLVYTGADTHYP